MLLKGGRLIDPANSKDEMADVLLVDGKVKAVGSDVQGKVPEGVLEVDVAGKVVCRHTTFPATSTSKTPSGTLP